MHRVISTAVSLLPILSAASVFDRSVHMVYALNDKLGVPSISDQTYLDAFDEANATALVPFFLNVANPQQYDKFIHRVLDKNIIIVPGVGRMPSDGDMDLPEYLDMATAMKNYTDYIRIENMQGFYDEHGKSGMQNFMNHCKKLGYKHIMMNPWPKGNDGSLVSFDCVVCDSAFNSVIVHRKSQYVLDPNPENWHIQVSPIDQVRQKVPGISVLINYESPGPQAILTNMEKKKAGSSLEPFNTTLQDISGKYKSYGLHWAPPMTQSYDSIDLGTWSWIASQLKKIAPPS